MRGCFDAIFIFPSPAPPSVVHPRGVHTPFWSLWRADHPFQTAPLDASTIAQHLVSQVPGPSGKPYSSICHHSNSSESACFVNVSEPGSSPVPTLSFKPGPREDWLSALRKEKTITVDGVKYDVDAGKRQESIGEMKSSKWVAYALSALVLRFWELTKVCGRLLCTCVAC